jgi:hypothetical protein
MHDRNLFFCIILMCFVSIIGEDNLQELSVQELSGMDSLFAVYQSAVRHALLAWQRVENGTIDEKEILEVVGRMALVKYFFEQAQDAEQQKINDDSRFWTHVMDHILIHVHQADLTMPFRSYIDETISYVREKCWNSKGYND